MFPQNINMLHSNHFVWALTDRLSREYIQNLFPCLTQCGEWNIGEVQHSRHHRKATDAEKEHWLGQVAPEMNWKDVNAFLYQFSRNTFDLDKFHKKIL